MPIWPWLGSLNLVHPEHAVRTAEPLLAARLQAALAQQLALHLLTHSLEKGISGWNLPQVLHYM